MQLEELIAKVHREAQFPPGERAEAYQDFLAGNRWQRGQRRIRERAESMGFAPRAEESVLDIGCQAGGFLQFAAMRGAAPLAGVDVLDSYLDCARLLASSCGQSITFRKFDATHETAALLAWVREFYPTGVDHLLLLSMEKHVGTAKLFQIVDAIGARRTYIETNAVARTGAPKPHGPTKLWAEVRARGGVHVGFSNDRNWRDLYRIER